MTSVPLLYFVTHPLREHFDVLLAMFCGVGALAIFGFDPFSDFVALFDQHDRSERSWRRQSVSILIVVWLIVVFVFDQNYAAWVENHGASWPLVLMVVLIPPLPAIAILFLRRSARRAFTRRPAEFHP